ETASCSVNYWHLGRALAPAPWLKAESSPETASTEHTRSPSEWGGLSGHGLAFQRVQPAGKPAQGGIPAPQTIDAQSFGHLGPPLAAVPYRAVTARERCLVVQWRFQRP